MPAKRPYGEDGVLPPNCEGCGVKFGPGMRSFWEVKKEQYWCYRCTYGWDQPKESENKKRK